MTLLALLVQGRLLPFAYRASMQTQSFARRIFYKNDRLRPILRAIVYVICTAVASALLFAAIAPMLGAPLRTTGGALPPLKFLVAFEAVSCIAIVGFAVLLRLQLDRRSIDSLGLAMRGPWVRLLGLGVFLGAGMQLLVFALETAFGYSHISGMSNLRSDAASLAAYIPLYLLVAVNEELLIRGYLFQNLWEEWGAPAGIILTSAFFAALHLGNPNSHQELFLTLIGLVAYGTWACLSVMWTKSLWPAVGVHFAWNLFEGPVLGFPVSGLNYGNTVIHQTIAGPNWFTGGSFGPESGASSLIALAAGGAVLYWLHKRGAFADAYDAREPYALSAAE
jgi:membrane protease YdiL (CAAX protease family)